MAENKKRRQFQSIHIVPALLPIKRCQKHFECHMAHSWERLRFYRKADGDRQLVFTSLKNHCVQGGGSITLHCHHRSGDKYTRPKEPVLTSYPPIMSNGETFNKLSPRERAIFTPTNSVVPTEWATDCCWRSLMRL